MANHNQLGELGETLAVKHLIDNGYTIICQNWRYRKFEIDIIASKNSELHFIEVKTRSILKRFSESDFSATYAVNRKKLEHLQNGVTHYIESNQIKSEVYLDLIAIDFYDTGEIEIKHYLNINE